MLKIDEDALICDLAETYHIYNWREQDIELISVLASGLRDNSRIKLKLSGQKIDTHLYLLASAVDRLAILNHQIAHKETKPKLITEILLQSSTDNDYMLFTSADEFEKEKERIIYGK